VEGCEGLHAAGVIYRDLKPENILIGGDGHIVLTDFGLSKEFPRKRPGSFAPNSNDTAGGDFYASSPSTPTEKQGGMPYWMNEGNLSQKDLWLATKANDTTTTFCGTAEYLAPEVIQGLPYSYEVDWWSFGTMLYEMLTGIVSETVPFFSGYSLALQTPFWANNHSDMYVRVLQDELTFPEDKAMDQDTKSLVRGLLQRNPALRLCEPRIKRHPYFSMIDWQHVYHKRYIPPYIPPIDPANASDTQNFDDAFLEMEPILDSEVENDDQTGSERDKSTTDIEPSYDEESVRTSPNADSPAVQPQAENDVFDGYSFKARNSVLIELDDDAGDGGSDGSDEDSLPAKESIIEQPEDELDAGQKTPDARVNDVQPTPTPASAVAEAFRRQQEGQRAETDATTVPEAAADEADADAAVPTTPRNKVEELPAEAPATPEKDLPVPSGVTREKVKTTPAPAVPAKEEKKVVTISETPKPKVVTKAVRNAKPARRERSGVAALDRDLNDVIDEHDEMAIDPEDDDWDFVETPGGQEDYKGQQAKSLFARGVVDRYRLKVFRKPSGTTPAKSLQRNALSSMSGLPMSESEFGELPDPASPSLSEKKRKAGGGLSLRKGRTFLRPKSPSATYSAGSSRLSRPGLSTQHSATISGSSSGVLLTPSASTPISSMPTNGTTSLKSQPSMNSVGSPGSSDTSVNGTRGSVTASTAELGSPGKSRGNKSSPDLRRQARESHAEGDESRQKGLKKMRKYTEQGAEKVMSLFSSPRPSPAPTQ
jgi:serum/glucocorticoid-regulated kinase 2